jgi:hypothetical protein
MHEIIGAVDETLFERMMLVFQDLSTGYLLREEVADERTFATWKALVDERLEVLGTRVLYLVSDRARAPDATGRKGPSMPEYAGFLPLRA